jgi:hypothetical protein
MRSQHAGTRHGSTSGNCQALPEGCSKPKTENFLIPKIEGDENNVSSEENYAKSNWKSDGEGSTAKKSSATCNGTSRVYNEQSRYTAQRAHPCKTLKGTGNLHEVEAAASSPCRVVWSGPASSADE